MYFNVTESFFFPSPLKKKKKKKKKINKFEKMKHGMDKTLFQMINTNE